MARKPRAESPGVIHHVVARGNAGQEIVRDDVDRRAFMSRLASTIERHGWSCLAYCLMDSHFHLVVETPQPNLGVGMKWLKSAYAQDFNYRHGRHGHLFGGRFYSQVISRDTHLVAAIIYVVLNPVRAGIVDRPEKWAWSSYAGTIGLVSAPIFLDVDKALELVDQQQDVARRMFATAVAETADGVRPVGSDPGRSRDRHGSQSWGQTPRV
jgi:REP-associated tyrosine transposase